MACKVARERTSNAPNAAGRYLWATLSVSFPGILQVKIKLQTRHWSRGALSDNCFAIQINVRFAPILLQKSKVASVRIFGETLKREPVDDSDNLSRATEVACEFCMRR
jgi:hypothetical protein